MCCTIYRAEYIIIAAIFADLYNYLLILVCESSDFIIIMLKTELDHLRGWSTSASITCLPTEAWFTFMFWKQINSKPNHVD